jgi:F0F1-type ATP synthase delta subunit
MLILQFLILQILVFSAVIYFLKKILTGDTQSAISRLNVVYQDLLNKQKELNEKIKSAEAEYQAKKQEASEIIEKMKLQSQDEMRDKKDEMVKKAKAEAEEIIQKAQASSEKLALDIEKRLRDKLIDFTSNLILRTVSSKNMEAFHKDLVEDFLVKGKELDLSSVGPQISILIIRSAMPLPPEVSKKIEQMVVQRLGRKLSIEEEVDKQLIAGVQLQFGTLILDASFANAIKEAAVEAKEEPLIKS